MSPTPPLLTMRRIVKSFGATRALAGVSLDVQAGRVLALIGENGAGKSTLMKVLSGAHRPDAGRMQLGGAPYQPAGPHAARAAGVAMIYQELNLAPDLSVEDNIMLGQEVRRGLLLDRAAQRRQVADVLARLGHAEFDPRTIVRTLSVGAQQLVEIARALVIRPQVIVFDEPTSSLPRQDVARLFEVIRGLRRAGLGIIYISHFLEEVREVADDFSVLRDGETVGGGELAGVTDAQVVALMAGRSVDELFPQVPHQVGPPLLEIDQLSGRRLPKHVSLTLHRGEILGISGLVGAGRTELLRCLLGLDPVRSGSVRLAGRPLGGALRQRLRAGLGLVSEDRKNEGLAQGLSLADNLTLSRLEPYSRLGWLRLGRRRAAVRDWIRRLEIKARDGEQPVHTLSGGNQQKVALARLLHQDADVLLLDEPTRGIDVGTKSAIYRLMGDWAARGKAIIFVSSYLPELLSVCDRVAVLARGQLRAVRPARDWTEHEILAVAVAADTQ